MGERNEKRTIRVDPRFPHAAASAAFLCFVGAADDWLPSWLLVNDPAVWSLNGQPQLPPVSSTSHEGTS